MTFDWVGDDPDYKTFEAAFKDGRVSLHLALYWGPIGRQWYELPTPPWTITDLGLPKVPPMSGGSSPWMLYPEVKKAGALLAPTYRNALYWNPRSGHWVTTEGAGSHGVHPDCVDQMRRELAGVDKLHSDRTLNEEEWRGQRERIIEDCLGTVPG
jgi:hypothetical protein